jgi:hypothetical protein
VVGDGFRGGRGRKEEVLARVDGLLALVGLIIITTVHTEGYRAFQHPRWPQTAWISVCAGGTLAYALLHIVPLLVEKQQEFDEQYDWEFVAHHLVYVVSMVGIIVFYGLERWATHRKAELAGQATPELREVGFWIAVGGSALFNFFCGQALHHFASRGWIVLLLFTGMMIMHYAFADQALLGKYADAYQRAGRWILAAALLAGWGLGFLVRDNDLLVISLIALVAGRVMLAAHPPPGPAIRYLEFVLGAATYGLLVLAVG